jgi:hypothetical protein
MPSPTPPRAADRAVPSAAQPAPLTAWIAGFLVPGAGHALVGQTQKAVVFFVLIVTMFLVGLAFGGRLFPFQLGDPLLFLAAAAEWMLAVPRLVAAMLSAGRGEVTSVTYEYGNTFLIAAGLLNLLVAFNAFDVALRRGASAGAPERGR